MKIGIFDSGLGGLITLKAVQRLLPGYDYLYLGDTKRVPYGSRTPETIYQWTVEAIDFLLRHNCALVIIACNTASVEALRKVQRAYLPTHFPDRRVLGVVVPTVESALEHGGHTLGIIGTTATIASGVYNKELRKKMKGITIHTRATPLLVPLIENGETPLAKRVLEYYLSPLLQKNIDSLILGCTHYALQKRNIRTIAGPHVRVISQDEVVPKKLRTYLQKHPEISRKLSQHGTIKLLVTEITPTLKTVAGQWFPGTSMTKITL